MKQVLTKGIERKELLLGSSRPASTAAQAERLPRDRGQRAAKERPVRGESKRCIKCRNVYPLEEFGSHNDTEDGRQSYCRHCKNMLGKRRRNMNVRARLRHHISTRATAQLGSFCPEGLTQDLESYLGYRISELVTALATRLKADYPDAGKLRDVLNEGWHVDHIHPLSRYKVIDKNTLTGEPTVDWEQFRACWAIDNLRAMPAEENLAKGARVQEDANPF